MRQVDQLIMIIPVVLNLKGNLEMNLSARLGTAANVGELDDPPVRRSMILGNLSLLQVQATVVSFVAACVSLILGLVVPRILPASNQPPSNSTIAVPLGNSMTTVVHQLIAGYSLHPRRPLPPLHPDGHRKSGYPECVRDVDLVN
jgi:solute carrier family 41